MLVSAGHLPGNPGFSVITGPFVNRGRPSHRQELPRQRNSPCNSRSSRATGFWMYRLFRDMGYWRRTGRPITCGPCIAIRHFSGSRTAHLPKRGPGLPCFVLTNREISGPHTSSPVHLWYPRPAITEGVQIRGLPARLDPFDRAFTPVKGPFLALTAIGKDAQRVLAATPAFIHFKLTALPDTILRCGVGYLLTLRRCCRSIPRDGANNV